MSIVGCIKRSRLPGGILLGLAAAVVSPASAQVQRGFINLSFEDPSLVTAGCRVYIAASQVPGWNTTHTPHATETSGTCTVPDGFTQTAPILELWRTPRSTNSGGTVNARGGAQIAELNAADASRIYQNVCLIQDENVRWRFSHRGRAPDQASSTSFDRMEMKVGATGTVVRVATTNNGTHEAPVVVQGSVDTPVNAPGNGTWVDYRGQFQYAGTTGVTNIGFEAVGGTTEGNLLDEIQIELAPFVEFIAPASSTPEGSTQNVPTLRVNGTVYTAFDVTVKITGGTAELGVDFETPGNSDTIVVHVPANNYDGVSAGSLFPLPVTVLEDSTVESSETIEFEIQPPTGANPSHLLVSGRTCGEPGQTTWTYTILDNDADLVLAKNAAEPVAVPGQPTQFDVTYTITVNNPTASLPASYSLSDVPGMDGDVNILSARYSLNGGADVDLGSGPPTPSWELQPQWRPLAAGQTDTYVLTVRIEIQRGGSTANDACTSPNNSAGAGLYNQAHATLQGTPANVDFAADACRSTPTPVWVTLNKDLQGRLTANDQVQIRLYSGGTQTATATTAGTGNSASTGLVVVPAGRVMQFAESLWTNGTGPLPLTGYRAALNCSNATAGSPVTPPSGAGTAQGTAQVWDEFTPAPGDDLTCTIVNTPSPANLSITKASRTATAVAGDTVVYDIVVANQGPGAADGTVVRDPAVAGLTCTGVVCASVAGGASCPGSAMPPAPLDVGALQDTAAGGGLVIPALPAGGTVNFELTCTVGLP